MSDHWRTHRIGGSEGDSPFHPGWQREEAVDAEYRVLGEEPPRRRKPGRLAARNLTLLILFVFTIITTFFANGPWYAVGIMTILLAHEMGHYLACRYHHVPATLPFFIPFPSMLGTLGAVILMRGRAPHRRALFDIAAAGPLAGLVFAIPAVIWGLRLSHAIEIPPESVGFIMLGDSLLFSFLSNIVLGPMEEGMDLLLHPLALAGWAGLLVTALNLLPAGQLDGGRVVYALFGKKSKQIYIATLVAFAVVCLKFYPGWILFIALILLFGFRSIPPVDDYTPLDPNRRLLGFLMMVFFLLAFTPVPIKF